jgi:hypothetical protein
MSSESSLSTQHAPDREREMPQNEQIARRYEEEIKNRQRLSGRKAYKLFVQGLTNKKSEGW